MARLSPEIPLKNFARQGRRFFTKAQQYGRPAGGGGTAVAIPAVLKPFHSNLISQVIGWTEAYIPSLKQNVSRPERKGRCL